MRRLLFTSALSGVLMLSGAALNLLHAQTQSTNQPTDKPTYVEVKDVPDTSKASSAQAALVRMRSILSKVFKHLSEARSGENGQPDVIKLNCVNEKLTGIKGLLKVSEEAGVSLQQALTEGDADTAGHEYRKIMLSLQKVEQFLGESEACVGALAVYTGDTEVEVIVDENVPTEDASILPLEPIDIPRPPPASPFQ
ncbi:MAG: hypothetical protein R3C68_11185 [Myxococcota bacterium]